MRAQEEDPVWAIDALKSGKIMVGNIGTPLARLRIQTRAGVLRAERGDCVLTDVWRFESKTERNSLAIEEDDIANREHYTDTDIHIRYRTWTRKFNEYLGSVPM
jgi:hypothetical protein